MNEVLGSVAARAASQGQMGEWAARTGIAFALEKRNVDAEHALNYVEGHTKTELVNALRTLGQQLRP
jgi:hypothetical protein